MSGAPNASCFKSLRRKATAVFIVAVFLCVPVLSRLHRRLTAIDTGAGYRYSRSIAVPLEPFTFVAVALSATASTPAVSTAAPDRIAVLDVLLPACLFVLPAIAVRAPPRR